MSRDKDDDSRAGSLICDAWNGSRSPLFLKFTRDFKTGADAIFLHEDDYSIWQAMKGTDQGGPAPGADQMPAQGQNGFANANRRRKKRQAKAFAVVYKHIDDERIREMLDGLPENGQRGTDAWSMIERECANGTSDLEILDYQRSFQNATIELLVGYCEDTIIMFSRELNAINVRLPVAMRYDENQLSVKILSNINSPESLALAAVEELRQPEGQRKFEHVVVVQGNNVTMRDYQALVTHFDSVWRGLFKQGVIRFRAPGKRNDSGALQVFENDRLDALQIPSPVVMCSGRMAPFHGHHARRSSCHNRRARAKCLAAS